MRIAGAGLVLLVAVSAAGSARSADITRVAGRGTEGFGGDGGPATEAALGGWLNIAVDPRGNLLVSDLFNQRVRRVDAASGRIETIAGTGTRGFAGDGGPATAARLGRIQGIAVDGAGNLYIADTENFRVRRVDAATGRIRTLAGNGGMGISWVWIGDGHLATRAAIQKPTALAVDGAGGLFIAGWFSGRIWRVALAGGTMETIAGNGIPGVAGDGDLAVAAQIDSLVSLATDRAGNLYVAETDGHRIRRIDAGSRRIVTVVGTGRAGFSGDGGPAGKAELRHPTGIAVDAAGNLWIADHGNHRIRRVDAKTGIITTVAGSGANDCRGRGGAALEMAICPENLAVDHRGRVYFTDTGAGPIVLALQAPPA